jgi:NAD(P)-dependent dehydrogenase (short-subunit alcohol dehydrogenase family)
MAKWTNSDIPDQKNKLVIVTGANSGVGYTASLALAGKGARVILAVRDWQKGLAAQASIMREHPQAQVEVCILDLADLMSVKKFADDYRKGFQSCALLINNAGVMAIPFRRTTDAFEMQLGTNHLGHYALTSLLLPVLLATPGARVVTVSSMMHQYGKIDFDNLDASKRYVPWMAYAQSKLANLLFAYEFQRRLAVARSETISVACHPGYSATNLQLVGPRMNNSKFGEWMSRLGNRLFAQSSAMGALPILFAAVAPGVQGGDYIGPTGWGGARGYPGKARSSERSHDQAVAARLWQVSAELTGASFAEMGG